MPFSASLRLCVKIAVICRCRIPRRGYLFIARGCGGRLLPALPRVTMHHPILPCKGCLTSHPNKHISNSLYTFRAQKDILPLPSETAAPAPLQGAYCGLLINPRVKTRGYLTMPLPGQKDQRYAMPISTAFDQELPHPAHIGPEKPKLSAISHRALPYHCRNYCEHIAPGRCRIPQRGYLIKAQGCGGRLLPPLPWE